MCIDRCDMQAIHPSWGRRPPDTIRYMSHPELRTAMIQSAEDPEFVYVVTDDKLPETLDEAAAMLAAWRTEHEAAA